MRSPLSVTPSQARGFVTRAVGLCTNFDSVAAVLDALGYVQLDPINVCGRMHDLILRSRIAAYREGDLLRHVHPEAPAPRVAFEHYLPGRGILVAFPMTAWPMIAAVTAARRAGGTNGWTPRHLSRSEEKIAERILTEIRERGPLTSDDIEHKGRAITAWGTPGRLVKHVLEAMFHRGDVLIAARREFRRVYDLPERVIPAGILARPLPDEDEIHRALVVLALRQRRLVALRRRDRALVEDLVQRVRLGSGEFQVLRDDLDALAGGAADSGSLDTVRLLAPLDPLIYDRAVTRRVWEFDYTWEVYTPAARRVRGYYALPVLSRGEIVGHVEPRIDRASRRLVVVSRRVRRGHATSDALRDLARFLGVRARG